MLNLHRIILNVGIGCAALLMSCQSMPTFISYQDVNAQEWDSRDTVKISIPAMESDVDECVAVGIRTTSACPYNRLSLMVTQRDSNGVVLAKDTIHFTFTDQKKRQKKIGFPYIETVLPTTKALHFQKDMGHTVEITHIMRSTLVCGVHAVGFEIGGSK